jgi:hypothetical protein
VRILLPISGGGGILPLYQSFTITAPGEVSSQVVSLKQGSGLDELEGYNTNLYRLRISFPDDQWFPYDR